MEPLGIATGCMAIARFAAQLVLGLQDVTNRYQKAAQTIDLLITRLQTVGSVMQMLSFRLQKDLDRLDDRTVAALRSNQRAFASLLRDIQRHLDKAGSGSTTGGRKLSSFGKAKHVWNEAAVEQAERKLDCQINALNLLLTLLQSMPEDARPRLLETPEAESTLKQAEDDAATYVCDDDLEQISSLGDLEPEGDAGFPVAPDSSEALGQPLSKWLSAPEEKPVSEPPASSGTSPPHQGSKLQLPNHVRPQLATSSKSRRVGLYLLSKLSSSKLGDILEKAAENGDHETVQACIDFGYLRHYHGIKQAIQLPLQTACRRGHAEVALVLVRNGAELNDPELFYLGSPLHLSSLAGSLNTIRVLYQLGANLEIEDNTFHSTPLQAVCGAANPVPHRLEVVKLLVSLGADLEAGAGHGRGGTPLSQAVTEAGMRRGDGRIDVVRYLIRQGAKVNGAGMKGNTPLNKACVYRCWDVVEMLLKAGADLDACCGVGTPRTALKNDQSWRSHAAASYIKEFVFSVRRSRGGFGSGGVKAIQTDQAGGHEANE